MKKNAMTVEYHAAQEAVTEAMARVRQANDELAEAHTALKVASMRLSKLGRKKPYLPICYGRAVE